MLSIVSYKPPKQTVCQAVIIDVQIRMFSQHFKAVLIPIFCIKIGTLEYLYVKAAAKSTYTENYHQHCCSLYLYGPFLLFFLVNCAFCFDHS